MKRFLFTPYIMSLVLHCLVPVAAFIDRAVSHTIDFAYLTLDLILPFRDETVLAVAGAARLSATGTEVTYLTDGLHRLAQPRKMRMGDPEDDEDEPAVRLFI